MNENVKEIQTESEVKCTKKDCRLREKELEKKEQEIKRLNAVFIKHLNIRYSFFLRMFEAIGDSYGKEFITSLIDTFEKNIEEINSYEIIKDTNGQEIKCSFCEESLRGAIRWGMDESFFQASDNKNYCIQCYRVKYPKECEEKIKKVNVLRRKEFDGANKEKNNPII